MATAMAEEVAVVVAEVAEAESKSRRLRMRKKRNALQKIAPCSMLGTSLLM